MLSVTMSKRFSVLQYKHVKQINAPLKKSIDTGAPKKPRTRTLLIRRPFTTLLPDIISVVMTEPKIKQIDLYDQFRDRLSDVHSLAAFSRKCKEYDIKKTCKEEASSREKTRSIVKTLDQVRKEKAEEHERKNMKYIDRAHEVMEEMIPTEKTINSYLDTVEHLNDLARKSYNIDREMEKLDQRGMGLFALINMNLHQEADTNPSPDNGPIVEV